MSVYYFFHRLFEPGPLKQGAGNELETRVGDDGNEHKPRTGGDGKEKGGKIDAPDYFQEFRPSREIPRVIDLTSNILRKKIDFSR